MSFSLEVVLADEGTLEVSIEAHSKLFSGCCFTYTFADHLTEIANTISGFPSGPGESRTVTIGAFDHRYAGGAARLVFRAGQRRGQTSVEVTLEGDRREQGSTVETATVVFPVEPATIDAFVRALHHLASLPSGGAGEALLPDAI